MVHILWYIMFYDIIASNSTFPLDGQFVFISKIWLPQIKTSTACMHDTHEFAYAPRISNVRYGVCIQSILIDYGNKNFA